MSIQDEIDYIFRGTTLGYLGSIYPRIGLTSTTTDPVVATLFATTASRHGHAVVYIIPVAKLAGRLRDNRGSNRLAELEGEIVVDESPDEIAAKARAVEVGTAKAELERLGAVFPLNIYNLADLNDALRLTKRLSREEIRAFVRAVEGQPG